VNMYNRFSKLKLCVAAIALSGMSTEQAMAGKNNKNINHEELHIDNSLTLNFSRAKHAQNLKNFSQELVNIFMAEEDVYSGLINRIKEGLGSFQQKIKEDVKAQSVSLHLGNPKTELCNKIGDFIHKLLLYPHQLTINVEEYKNNFLCSPSSSLTNETIFFFSPLHKAAQLIDEICSHEYFKEMYFQNEVVQEWRQHSLSTPLQELKKNYLNYFQKISLANFHKRKDMLDPVLVIFPYLNSNYFISSSLTYHLLSTDRLGFVTKRNTYGCSPVAQFGPAHFKRSIDSLAPYQESRTQCIVPQVGRESSMASFCELLIGSSVADSTLLILKDVPHLEAPEGTKPYQEVEGKTSLNLPKDAPHPIHEALGLDPQSLSQLKLTKRTYSVQASKTVEGEILIDWIKRNYKNSSQNREKLDNFDHWAFACMATNPKDASGNNFAVRGGSIKGFDNDHVFGKEFFKGKSRKGHFPEVKSIFFCFEDLMSKEISQDLRTRLLSIPPHQFFLIWLSQNSEEEMRYKKLVSLGYLSEKSYKLLGLPISYEKNSIIQSLRRIIQAREVVKSNPKVTVQELFEEMQPLLGMYYKKMRELYKDPLECFEAILSNHSNTSLEKALNLEESSLPNDSGNIKKMIADLSFLESEEKSSLSSQEIAEEIIRKTDLKDLSASDQIVFINTAIELFKEESVKGFHESWKDSLILAEAIKQEAPLKVIHFLLRRNSTHINQPNEFGNRLTYYVENFGGRRKESLIQLLLQYGLKFKNEHEEMHFAKQNIQVSNLWNSLGSDLQNEILSHLLRQRAPARDIHNNVINIQLISKAIYKRYKEIARIALTANVGLGMESTNLSEMFLEGLMVKPVVLPFELNFQGAYLPYANFSGSVIRGGNFRRAYMPHFQAENANFSYSFLIKLRNEEIKTFLLNAGGTIEKFKENLDKTLEAIDKVKRDVSVGQSIDYLMQTYKIPSHALSTEAMRTINNFPDVEGASFRGAVLTKSNFSGARLQYSSLRDAKAQFTSFKKAKFNIVDMRQGKFLKCDFSESTFSKTKADNASFVQANFHQATIKNSNFRNADFSSAGLKSNQPLSNKKAKINNSNFSGAKLDGALYSISQFKTSRGVE